MGASNMQEKINKCEVKLNMQKQNSQLLGVNTSSGFDFPTPLINYDEEDNTEKKQDSQKLELLASCTSGFDFPTPLINYDEEGKKESLRAQKQKVEEVIAYEPEALKDSSDEAQKVED